MAQQAYNDLLGALDAPPLLVLYASDGGTAEKYAKKLLDRAKARRMSATIGTFDSMTIESLAQEEYVAFVTSVAGQGEPPQNGRRLFKALNAAALRNENPFSKLRYAVFGLGDSHYWPRPEDAHYYNKPSKDLDSRLEQLGGERFADLGLGDDQDADGPETGYKVWEPKVWKALGVDSIQVTEAEPEPITNEHIKAASEYLRGTIAEGLEDTTTGALAPSDTQLTKFHGIYQQDDRDIRDERQAQKVEPAYSFMIRVRTPGGVCTPEQWLQMDQISDEHANGTLKITTRATFQFHGVIKRHLKPSIQKINRVLMDTLAACGDVNRNVICSAIPSLSRLHHHVYEFSKLVSNHLLPRTTAYHEIWLDKKMVAGEAVKDFEPLYGEFYLPRKFKIAVAVPPHNDVDVFANDLGFIAIVDEDGELEGFNVAVGGGMGVTHGNKKTYPRLGDVIGFCTVEQGPLVAEKVMLTQRDNGNRVDRKNARLKYTIDRMGLDNFKKEVENRLGFELAPARPYSFESNIDHFGWTVGEDGRHHVTVYIENGRVQDEPGREFKTGLREIAKVHKGTFRLTSNQHLVISEIPPVEVPRIKALLAEYKLDNLNYTGLRLSASACVAFPTCGLAMAESERYLPVLVDKVEQICEENGLRHDSIVMRMTGCPNGCARPYVAEVAFVGKAPGSYAMLLGGGYYGQRLNKIYRESVSEPEILAILGPMIKRYALERHEGERFGDFVIRAGYIAPTTEGKLWYDRMGGEGGHREISVA
jgi:sulfite reductase (NADPH) hemoprotein beta-component